MRFVLPADPYNTGTNPSRGISLEGDLINDESSFAIITDKYDNSDEEFYAGMEREGNQSTSKFISIFLKK